MEINKRNTIKNNIEKDKNKIEQNKEINDYKIENIVESAAKNIDGVKNNEEIDNIIHESDNTDVKDDSKNINSDGIYIQEIEEIILKDGMKDFYEKMPPKKQEKFEKELKKTSIEIFNILKKVGDNILKAINKIFSLIRKLIFQLGISDYGYTEKMIKNKVEDIIKIKRGEDK